MTAIPTASGNNDFSLSGHTHAYTYTHRFCSTIRVHVSRTPRTHELWMFPELRLLQVTPRRPRCATTTNPELIVACLPSNVRAQCSPSQSFVVSSIALCFRRLARAMFAGPSSFSNSVHDNPIANWNRIFEFSDLRRKLNKSSCIKSKTLIV